MSLNIMSWFAFGYTLVFVEGIELWKFSFFSFLSSSLSLFIVVQVQLSPFPPITPLTAAIPTSHPWSYPPLGPVHVSPIHAPWQRRQEAHTSNQYLIMRPSHPHSNFFQGCYVLPVCKKIIYWFEREKNSDLLRHFFMYSLVDSYMCLDQGLNPQPWCIRMML